METVPIILSGIARETLFGVCRNARYTNDKLLSAASLLGKLREGTKSEAQKLRDNNGNTVDYTVYKNFLNNVEIALTYDEKNIACEMLKAVQSWHPDEADIVVELQKVFQIQLLKQS